MTDSTNDGQIVDPPTPPLQKLPVIIEDASKPAEMDMQISPEGLNLGKFFFLLMDWVASSTWSIRVHSNKTVG